MFKSRSAHMDFDDFVDIVPPEFQVCRTGNWLPSDYRIHRDWLSNLIAKVEQNPKDLHPILLDFKSLMENSSRIYLLANSMFEQVPSKRPYCFDPNGQKQVRDYNHMLELFNHILTTAPEWNDRQYTIGLVGAPFTAILDWPMGTPSGLAFFFDPEVNRMFKRLLNKWTEYLSSTASTYVLGRDSIGWFSDYSLREVTAMANLGQTSYAFEEIFKCDPAKEHYGFKSWDAFFTRCLHQDKRPVAEPGDDNIIANACEAEPYRVARNIAQRDRFWMKGQPYSLMDMLDMDPLYENFVGGTIYQAFLSALSYHRWHAPVSGRVVKAYVKDGTYFSEPPCEGLSDLTTAKGIVDDRSGKTDQGYISATATRAIIFFEADNKDLGLVCFLGIGMAEVSSCDITVKEGQQVKKGDEIGMFHYGGSTHCVLFQRGVELHEFPDTENPTSNVAVRSKLAVAKKRSSNRKEMGR